MAFPSTPAKRPRRTSETKLAGSTIQKRLVDIELATVSALRALQMDIEATPANPRILS